jgi:hypothetical protein
MATNSRSEWKWTVVDDRAESDARLDQRRSDDVRVLGFAVGVHGAAIVFDGDDIAISVALN